MAIRPVDLQQVVMKSPDVTRDASVQQQAATAQQAHTTELAKRQAQQAETVQQFEEAGAVLIREREARQDQRQRSRKKEAEAEELAEEEVNPKSGSPARLGRHVDLSA
jgi:hypothetical protein